MLPPMEKILRTPMAMAPCLPPLPYVAYCYQQSLFRCITCQDDCIQLPHATKRLLNANFLKITFAKRTFSVSMATLRDNKQALCGVFQFLLTTTNPPRNSITITEAKYHRIVTE